MAEQLTLEDFRLPEVATDERADLSPNAKVVCGECGALMKNMGVQTSRYTKKHDNVIGSWMFSCRIYGHASAVLVVMDDGSVDKYNEKGKGHEVVEIDDNGVEIASGTGEKEDDLGFVYPDEEYKDPTMWEEPE